jgi:L-ascorbate metabolism protein UlaG (beta-lactamase superfamily)
MPRKLKRVLKMMIFLVVLLITSALLFVACAPQLGSAGDDERILNSSHYSDGKFFNSIKTNVSSSNGKMFNTTIEYLTGKQQREPVRALPSIPVLRENIGNINDLKVTWLGHSTCLIEMDGQVILTDPMFSDRASPFTFMGPKRFTYELPIQLEELPQIDAVLISHDHYDHLDYQSIRALKDKTERFYVPLGVGGHLERWGVASEQIVELDWWEDDTNGMLTFTATPARHFSGRGLVRNKTLWASWVIRDKQHSIYFGGDSGYFDGFKTIGEKFGPFDVTMLESGAYNEAWLDIHMLPEQTVQAHLDLQGKVLLPIHWGKFNLSVHSWTEPIERLLQSAESKSARVVTPRIGETLFPGQSLPQAKWWAIIHNSKST